MQHRIFLVPPLEDAHGGRRHWEQRHGDLFAGTPGLLGYRQNRPISEEWARGTARFCSETWFADRETERRAYRSTYYRETVTPDEAGFLARAHAWSAAVVDGPGDVSRPPPGGARVLWFDESPPAGISWERWRLAVSVPRPGRGTWMYTAIVEDVTQALRLTGGARQIALVSRPWDYAPAKQ